MILFVIALVLAVLYQQTILRRDTHPDQPRRKKKVK